MDKVLKNREILGGGISVKSEIRVTQTTFFRKNRVSHKMCFSQRPGTKSKYVFSNREKRFGTGTIFFVKKSKNIVLKNPKILC